MATATDELILLERVFLRLGAADTDEQLQSAICKFLPPVLLKLSSPQEEVRKKVMEVLMHINKRIKNRPQIQLPMESLLLQYQDPAASSFVTNFTIIYIKLGYPRLTVQRQAELIPILLNALQDKPLPHQDSLLLLIMPVLGNVDIPIDPDKRASYFNLQDKPKLEKQFLNFMLDMLLLPYGAVNPNEQEPGKPIDWTKCSVPAGMSEYSFKRVIGDNTMSSDQLEQTKIGILKFITGGFFKDSDILIHLIVAASDTRFGVTNVADMELRKMANTLDWASRQLAAPLYSLFLGTEALTQQKEIKQELKKMPANIRIRLKLMQYLCKVTKEGFIIPACVQVVFDSLYGSSNTNQKLKSMALQFTLSFVQQCDLVALSRVAQVLLNGMLKLINEESEINQMLTAYSIVGQLGNRIPSLVNKDFKLLQNFFDMLATNEGDMRRTIRDSLICMATAFTFKEENEAEMGLMAEFLSKYIESSEPYVRFVTVHYAATIFPANYAPARFLLLLASGDQKPEVQTEALKSLYGTSYKNERCKYFSKQTTVPDFSKIMAHIYLKVKSRLESSNKVSVGNKTLPFNILTFTEIISYLRICLAKSSNIINLTDVIEHPYEETPLIGRYLQNLYSENADSVFHYVDIVLLFGQTTGDEVALTSLLEIVGTIPENLIEKYSKERNWVYNLIFSKKEYIRELAAKIYAIFCAYDLATEFTNQISKMITCTKDKIPENQQGALFALSHMIERRLVEGKKRNELEFDGNLFEDSIKIIYDYLDSNNSMLSSAAVCGIGIIGKTYPLPLSVDGENYTKKSLVIKLYKIFTGPKTVPKLREKAVLSLGYICLGERFPHTQEVAEKLIEYADQSKDINIHLCIGEALVCCVQGPSYIEARDSWKILPIEYIVPFSDESNNLLIFVIEKLLLMSEKTSPNSKQAVCTWLLKLLKHNYDRECIYKMFPTIHVAFLNFLSEKNDTVQDMATKGLQLIYQACTENDRKILVDSLVNHILQRRQESVRVSADDLKKDKIEIPDTSGNLVAYKEICILAVELNRPDLVYELLYLSNGNPLLKEGGILGFPAVPVSKDILEQSSLLASKLFKYQHYPIPKVQQSFSNILRAITPSVSKAIEQHYQTILKDLCENLTNPSYHIRLGCCNALNDLFKNQNILIDYTDSAPELWRQLFRVMDDCQEKTRTAANRAATIFSRICVRYCDVSRGKSSEQMLNAILPILIETGIPHPVDEIRRISLYTVSQLVISAGVLLKPLLPILIPALINYTGELEHDVTEFKNFYANSSQIQEAVGNLVSENAKRNFASETISKSIIYIDANTLKELMPKVMDLLKTNPRLGAKVACTSFIIKLSVHIKEELQPYVGKIISILRNDLLNRDDQVKKNGAITIGHIVNYAKESTLNKLFTELQTMYMDKDDNAIRLAIGQTFLSINTYNQDVLKKYSHIVIPLTFYAMHATKDPENQKTVELWEELWNEITPGSETGIKQNLTIITNVLNATLDSASWTVKAQSANAISTLAEKLGSSIDAESRNSLINMLINGLQGRIWNGKERLLNALATLACNNKEALKQDTMLRDNIISLFLKESKKENVEYRRYAIKAFTDVLHELDLDKFIEFYDIAKGILSKLTKKNEDDDDDSLEENKKKREEKIKLLEIIYEGFGKAWPSSKETQDKYAIEVITHFHEVLPNSTRPIQVTILSTIGLFVDKLLIVKHNVNQSTERDEKVLDEICSILFKILRYAISIAKYNRIRKEALNIVINLLKLLKDTNRSVQHEQLAYLMKDLLIELSKDNQPEIRSRIVDIKKMLEFEKT